MKTRRSISLFCLLLALASGVFSSCQQKKDPVKIADDHNDAKFHDNDEENHSHLIVDISEILLQQIELARLAQNNSIKKDVRKTGQQLEMEYTQSYSLLKQIALKKTITVPEEVSSSDKKTDTDLGYEISDKFDNRYFELAKKGHEQAIETLESIKSKCKHADIQAWADNALLTCKKNLAALVELEQRLQLTKPNTTI